MQWRARTRSAMFLFGLLLVITVQCSAVDPEVFMNTSQLITSKGYPCEEHEVHTSDGYILGVQRIPHGLAHATTSGPRPVVLLQHGLLSCSACWVENLANESLGFMMADAGFDVWLGNSRGNTYSKKHERLNPSHADFWRFSWDEMAQYDLPATVDYILSQTGASQIFYAGHSQGAEIAFAQLSRDKVLASKIKMFGALAPAVYLGHVQSPLKHLVPLVNSGQYLLEALGTGEFMPTSGITKLLGRTFCAVPGLPNFVCDNVMFVIAGYDAAQLNATRVPVYVAQHPAGTSTHNIIHYAQSIKSGKFQLFDYGMIGNLIRYKQTHPPELHPENVETPVVLYSGTSDWLVTPTDVTNLAPRIRHLVKHKVIQNWQHLDFMWAMDAPEMCFNDLISEFTKVIHV